MPESPDLLDPKESFFWPGEAGFTNFPKQVPDDCIEYTVHINPSNSSTGTNPSSSLQSQAKIRTRLQEIRRGANELVQQHLNGYIWQREAFGLEIVHENRLNSGKSTTKPGVDETVPGVGAHLAGSTSFGDSIADEWLVVFLLRELSRRFDDVWIHVCDADGEFLLVEAANVLPQWLNPEVAPNRVWIHNGQLRIIPQDGATTQSERASSSTKKTKKLSKPSSRELSLADALSFIHADPGALIHSPEIEQEAFYRLRNHPVQISAAMHNAQVRIPRKLAYVLHTAPSHISPAVEAFYLRDPISVRPLRGDPASLRFPPEDFVTVSVRFTRVSYAQLKSQDFPVPRAWAKAMVPAATITASENDFESSQQKEPLEDATAVTGMKITCGFEMLLADPEARDRRCVREIELLLDDVEEDNTLLPSDKDISSWPGTDDDEGWLDVNFEDFEAELAGRSKKEPTTDGGKAGQFGDQAAQENLRKIVEKFELFLNDEGAGPDGAELGDEMDDDDDSDENNDSDSATSGEDHDASFDEGDFWIAMRDMLGIPPSDAPLASSSTGKTTQRTASGKASSSRVRELDSDEDDDDDDDDDDDEGDILELTRRMEAELKAAGALHLDGDDGAASKPTLGPESSSSAAHDETDVDSMSDYILAKNLLESFKSQGGAAGPVGNLMKLMGLELPRDEGAGDQASKS